MPVMANQLSAHQILAGLQSIGVHVTPEALPILNRALQPGGDLVSAIAEVQQYGLGSGTPAGSGHIRYYDTHGNVATTSPGVYATRTPSAQEAFGLVMDSAARQTPEFQTFAHQYNPMTTNMGTTTTLAAPIHATQGNWALAPIAPITPNAQPSHQTTAQPAQTQDVNAQYAMLSPAARNFVASQARQVNLSQQQAQQLGQAYDDWQGGRVDIQQFVEIGRQVMTGAGAAGTTPYAAGHATQTPSTQHATQYTTQHTTTGNAHQTGATTQHATTGHGQENLPTGNVTTNAALVQLPGWVFDAVQNRWVQGGAALAGAAGVPGAGIVGGGLAAFDLLHRTGVIDSGSQAPHNPGSVPLIPQTPYVPPHVPPHVPPPVGPPVPPPVGPPVPPPPGGGESPRSLWHPTNVDPYALFHGNGQHGWNFGITHTTTGGGQNQQTQTTPQSPFNMFVEDYLRGRATNVLQGQEDFGQEALFRNALHGVEPMQEDLLRERTQSPFSTPPSAPGVQSSLLNRIGNQHAPANVGAVNVTPAFGGLSGGAAGALEQLAGGLAPASPTGAFVSDQSQGRATGMLTPAEQALRQTTGAAIGDVDTTNRFLQPGGGLTTDLGRAGGAAGPAITMPPVHTQSTQAALARISDFTPTAGHSIIAPTTPNVAPLDTAVAGAALNRLENFAPTGAPITAPNVTPTTGVPDQLLTQGINRVAQAAGGLGTLNDPAQAALARSIDDRLQTPSAFNTASSTLGYDPRTGARTPIATTPDFSTAQTLGTTGAAQTNAAIGANLLDPLGALNTSLQRDIYGRLANPYENTLANMAIGFSGATGATRPLDYGTGTAGVGRAEQAFAPIDTSAAATPLRAGMNFGAVASPLNAPVNVGGAEAALRGVETNIAATPYAAQAAGVLSLTDPATQDMLRTLMTRATGGLTPADEAAQNAILDQARQAVLQYDRSDPYGVGGRGLAGSGVAAGLFAREAGRVAQDAASRIAVMQGERQAEAAQQLGTFTGQDLTRRQAQAGTLTELAGMETGARTTERQLQLQQASSLADTVLAGGRLSLEQAQSLSNALVQSGQLSLQQATALSDALTRGQALTAEQQQALANTRTTAAGIESQYNIAAAGQESQLRQAIAANLQAQGQATDERTLNALKLDFDRLTNAANIAQGGAIAQAQIGVQAGVTGQQLAQSERESARDFALGAGGLTLEQNRAIAQNFQAQGEAQADLAKTGVQLDQQRLFQAAQLLQTGQITAAELASQYGLSLAQLAAQMRQAEQTYGLNLGGLELEAQVAESDRQNQVSALRLQAQQAAASGNIDLANTLNARAETMAQTGVAGAQIGLEAQTAEAERLQGISSLELAARQAEASGNIELANLYRQQAETSASTQLGAAELGLRERMGAREILAGAGEAEAGRRLSAAEILEGTRATARAQEAATVESALDRLATTGESAAERTLQGQLGAANLLTGREATGAQFALGSAQLNADIRSRDADRQLNAMQTASTQLIQLSDQIQSGEIGRAQLEQMAREGNLDGVLDTMRLMSDAAAQREGLSQNVRQQGIEMASVLSNYQAEQGRLKQMENELNFQIQEARANRDFVRENLLTAIQSEKDAAKWSTLVGAAATLMTGGAALWKAVKG